MEVSACGGLPEFINHVRDRLLISVLDAPLSAQMLAHVLVHIQTTLTRAK